MAKVLAIIVTYNALPWIDRCIGSLEGSKAGVDVFVVDNCSTDGTAEYVSEKFPDAILHRNKENSGFGAANNIGLSHALAHGYDFVYLLNQDAWVGKDTISTLIDCWNKEYGVLSPIQNDTEGRMDSRFRKKCRKYIRRVEKAVSGDRIIVNVPFVMAAHWLLSREAVETTGGFSPAFRQYGEDDNYIDRLHYHGFKVGVVPGASAVHDRSGRKPSKEQRMRLKCISTIVKASNPGRSFLLSRMLEPLELLAMSLKNFSLVPIRYIPELFRRFPELKIYRRASRKKGAFLG